MSLELLDKTSLKEKIDEIKRIYDELELKQKDFCSSFDIACIDGCGKCCENYIPDIKIVEAYFIAYGLIKEGRDKEIYELLNNNNNDKTCPLFIKDSKYHCSLYKYRPLVCRLFGASFNKDKNGDIAYRNCKWKNEEYLSLNESNKKKDLLIFMSDYGEMLQEINPDDSDTELLTIAVKKALDNIYYILDLEEKQNGKKESV